MPTSRTHQASASLRLRATPAATRVSSTARSGILRRVITGRLKVVKIRVSSPQLAPHATWRGKRRSASRAILTRSSRVSSRNRSILATRAASRASGAVPAASSTSGRTPSTRISSPSEVTSGGPANHAVGTRLANQAPMPSAMDYIITPRPLGTQGGDDGRVMNAPALAAFALAAVASAGDLTAILRHDKRLEYATKPAVMVFLIAAALLIHPASPGERALFVVALVLGLAGDVCLMLPDALLLAVIGAFLAGHLAYAVGFRFAGFSAAGLVAGGIIAAATAGLLLRRVLTAPRAQRTRGAGPGQAAKPRPRLRHRHLAHDRERHRQRQSRRCRGRPALLFLGRDLRLVPLRQAGALGPACEHRHVPGGPGPAGARAGGGRLGSRLRLRLGSDHAEQVDDHLGAVLLHARRGVVPGVRLHPALHVEEAALAQVLPGNLCLLAEDDQAVELGLLLGVARFVLARICVGREAHVGDVHALRGGADLRVLRQVADEYHFVDHVETSVEFHTERKRAARRRQPCLLRSQPADRIDRPAVYLDLEMEVRAGREPGGAELNDDLAGRDRFAGDHLHSREMAVEEPNLLANLHGDVDACPTRIQSRVGDSSRGRVHCGACWRREVHAGVDVEPRAKRIERFQLEGRAAERKRLDRAGND